MLMTDNTKRIIASYMRTILRNQCRASWMDSRLTRFIKAEGLLEECHRFGFTIQLTEAGRKFLDEVEGE